MRILWLILFVLICWMMFHRDQGPDKMLGGKSGADKKKWFEWSRIHNFTSILIIIGYQL